MTVPSPRVAQGRPLPTGYSHQCLGIRARCPQWYSHQCGNYKIQRPDGRHIHLAEGAPLDDELERAKENNV